MFRPLPWLTWMCCAGVAWAADSFEDAVAGPLREMVTSSGRWTAAAGHAEIHAGHAKSGRQSLRVVGEGEREATLVLPAALSQASLLSFWAERWTSKSPFRFRVDARAEGQWVEIVNGDGVVKVGGFLTRVEAKLPAGTREVRFRCTAPASSGVMIDDLMIAAEEPMRVIKVETRQPVAPVMLRSPVNPVLGFCVHTAGSLQPLAMEAVELSLEGTTRLDDVEAVEVLAGGAEAGGTHGARFGEVAKAAGTLGLAGKAPLVPGENWFWISVRLKATADLDSRVDAGVARVSVSGKTVVPAEMSPAGHQRIGTAVRMPGDDGSQAFRIPGLVRTKAGSLVAVYDIRRRHMGDLPADIDVGVSRSTDGGRTWEPMRVAIDMGNDPKFAYDGVGDPCVFADDRTGRVWIAALWSHGTLAPPPPGPGLEPDQTGQLVLVHSDDDGRTWSQASNITKQVKDPAWRLLLAGPGTGITLRDGTLVFPAQFKDALNIPHSTLIWSGDRGKTWKIGSGVKERTTEAQLVELADGSIMINCRDDRGGARTVAVTKDLGKTWQLHPTDRKALPESVCMASLLRWEPARGGDTLFFSNPNTTRGRHSMTIKVSRDQGMTWPEAGNLLYDARSCCGYSCLAPADDEHLGVLYEGNGSIQFLRIPLTEWTR